MVEVSLAEVAVERGLIGGPFGSNLVSSDYAESGIPVIRGTNMIGRWVGGEYVFVSKEKYSRDLSRNSAVPGDLIFTQRGTLGQVAIVPNNSHTQYVISQSQMRLRVNPALAEPNFVYYAATAPSFVKQVHDNAISTGVPHINLGILARLTIPKLPLRAQRAIVEVLGSLDDKIATNVRLIRMLEELMTLHWLEATADGDSVPLSTLATFVNGKAFTKDASGTGRMVIRIAEINSGVGPSTVYNDIDVAENHLARPGDILFAWSGSLTVARWFREEAVINQHIFKVIPANGVPHWLATQALHATLQEFKAIAADKATTMGHIQRRHLDEPVRVPRAGDVSRLDALMSGLWHRALAAEKGNLRLIATRDELLPLLVSGQIHVRDANEVVEGLN
jgi:type I restriction enzyme S subunit